MKKLHPLTVLTYTALGGVVVTVILTILTVFNFLPTIDIALAVAIPAIIVLYFFTPTDLIRRRMKAMAKYRTGARSSTTVSTINCGSYYISVYDGVEPSCTLFKTDRDGDRLYLINNGDYNNDIPYNLWAHIYDDLKPFYKQMKKSYIEREKARQEEIRAKFM